MLYNFENIISIICILASIVFFVISFLSKNFYKNSDIKNIFIIRFLLFFIFSLILLNPKINYLTEETTKLKWNVYLDNSLSMSYHQQPSATSYISGVNKILEKLKKKGVETKIYNFGTKLKNGWDYEKQTLKDGSTNLGSVISHIKFNNNHNIAGSLIITDGQANFGKKISSDNFENLNPIHIIGIGTEESFTDIAIKSIISSPTVINGSKTEVEVEVSSTGITKEKVNVTLSNGKKILGSKSITLKGLGIIEKIRFLITPTEMGEVVYKVQVNTVPEEINIENNKQFFSIQVLKDNYKVAIITGAPNFNTQVIKNILTENKNYSLDHFVYLSNSYSKPIQQFWDTKYDLIIFDNHPIKNNKNEWNDFLRIFAKKILVQKSSIAFFPGYDTEKETLSSYLKLMDIGLKESLIGLNGKFDWYINENWGKYFPFKNNYDKVDKVNKKPPLFVDMEVDTLGVDVLANFLISDVKIPLLILKEKTPLRSMLFTSPDLYSLKLSSENLIDNDINESLFNPIFSWLMKRVNGKDFYFRANKNSYQQGEQVTIIGKPVKDNQNILNGSINIFNNDGVRINSKPIYYDKQKNLYTGSFWASLPGSLRYEVQLFFDDTLAIISDGIIKVKESQVELNKVFLNKTPLETLSNKTNGTFQLWKNRSLIIEKINNSFREDSYLMAFYFINKSWLLIIFFVLIIIELFYRRKIGLA